MLHLSTFRAQPALHTWLAGWNAVARWTRYEVEHLEPLLQGKPCLIVGYHGRPLAWDLCMLTTELHRRLGYLPHGIIHGGLAQGPMADFVDGLGFVTADGPELAAAVARGEHILVAPGGTHEGCRRGETYTVAWGKRTGYLKLALRYGLPIVPVAASGVDSLYLSLNNGERWGKRLGVPARLPLWLGLGPMGFFPFSPPFPAHVRQRVGDAIDVRALVEEKARVAGKPMTWQDVVTDPAGRPILAAAHQHIQAEVQSILNQMIGRRHV